ncbi:membrane protein [Pseudoalteromonas sp. A25]|uniref:YdcF family protein n=1 Tax=Pseudoalteromonas sp. A25 TaxID=116092 RepID=UPI001260DA96|nr:ElyC/SanA/YdcF family protein [Pseudoalteromonas sp. A25]BBN80963.1 membrane protein [Pseudoalteromonas sp. A25]
MFVIKKVLGSLLMPLPLSLIAIAICLLFISKNNKKSYGLTWLIIVSTWLISTPFIADKVISPVEMHLATFNTQKKTRVDKIVVLGCDVYANSRLNANAQLGGCALSRLTEGVRLAHYYKSAQLVVSGQTSANLMKQTAIELGISASRIKTNPNALDTKDEAKQLAPYLVDTKVALVTSASHMARAKDLFIAQGIDVFEAPTQFYNFASQPPYRQFIAQVTALKAVTAHFYELLGKSWIQIRRWLDPEAL